MRCHSQLIKTGRSPLAAISDALSVSLDELVFGMSYEMKRQSDKWRSVIEDCSISELEILTEVSDALKKAIRRHIDKR